MSNRKAAQQRSRTKSLCPYCVTREASTSDHVIPRCLFVRPFPSNMVTVRVCLECNQAKADDDVYLRDFLVADFAASPTPAAETLFRGEVRRSIRRNSSEVGRAILRDIVRSRCIRKAASTWATS
jgi:hypothetical protein